MSEWIYRPSSKYPGEGLHFRYVQQEYGKHGMTEHTEIQVDKKSKHDLPSIICRACCRDVEKRRAYKRQEQEQKAPAKVQIPLSYNRFKND